MYLSLYTKNPYYVVCCGCLAVGARAHAIWAGPIRPSHDHIMGDGGVKVGARDAVTLDNPTNVFFLF